MGRRPAPKPRDAAEGAGGLTCRLATIGELDRIAEFSRRAAGVDIPPSYWRWRYFDNPAGASGIAIALDGGEIVGLMSAFATEFSFGDRRLLASQMGHNDVLKSHRSSTAYFQLAGTVFRELVDERGIDFCFGIAVKETRDLSMVLMGFDEVGSIGKLVKVINPAPFVRKRWRLPLPRWAGAPAVSLLRRRARAALRNFSASPFEHFRDVLDGSTWESGPRRLGACREPSYMEWRYVDCPLRYDKLQLRSSDGKLVGLVVLHTIEEQGVRYGVLDECLELAGDPGALADLAVAGFLERDVDAIVAWASPATPLHRALSSRGFIARPSPRSLIVRRLSDGVSESVLASADSWYYTIGDTEYWLFPVAGRGTDG